MWLELKPNILLIVDPPQQASQQETGLCNFSISGLKRPLLKCKHDLGRGACEFLKLNYTKLKSKTVQTTSPWEGQRSPQQVSSPRAGGCSQAEEKAHRVLTVSLLPPKAQCLFRINTSKQVVVSKPERWTQRQFLLFNSTSQVPALMSSYLTISFELWFLGLHFGDFSQVLQ